MNFIRGMFVVCLVLSFSAFASTATEPQAAGSPPFTLARIVKPGDPTPFGHVFFSCQGHLCTCALAGHRPLGNDGQIVFAFEDVTTADCFDGIYLADRSANTVAVADHCHDSPFGHLDGIGPANVNSSGGAVFNAFPPPSFPATLFLRNSTGIARLIGAGDLTPFGVIKCGFSEPFINDNGDIAFSTCTGSDEVFGVFVVSNGQLTRLVKDGDPAPDGQPILMGGQNPIRFNNRGDVLFATFLSSLFGDGDIASILYTARGLRIIEKTGDVLPDGHVIPPRFNGRALGDLNDKGQVVFSIGFNKKAQPPGGIYLYSDGTITKMAGTGDPSPLGGMILSFVDPSETFQFPDEFPTPAINSSGAILFQASLTGATAPSGLFLASSHAMVKVVAVGDQLETGEVIESINTFALNDHAQVAFSAYGKGQRPLGIFLASPAAPAITSASVKSKKGNLQLVVDGAGFITNDSIIEINGTPLDGIRYPEGSSQAGGATTRLLSADPRLSDLVPQGQQVQVTVSNPLTITRSAAFSVTR